MTREDWLQLVDLTVPFNFRGPISQLLGMLRAVAEDYEFQDMPCSPEGLGVRLRRLVDPLLRQRGITVEFLHDGKQRLVTITRQASDAIPHPETQSGIVSQGPPGSDSVAAELKAKRHAARLDWETGKTNIDPRNPPRSITQRIFGRRW